MTIYQRSNARILQDVRLQRSFYNSGTLFDPYEIDRIELWRGTYDLEHPELLESVIYGSRVVIVDTPNSAYLTLGLTEGTDSISTVGVVSYEESFVLQTSFVVTHGLTDRFVNVVIYNISNQMIMPDEIISLDDDNIRVSFAMPQSGTIKVYGTEELQERTQYVVKEFEVQVAAVTDYTLIHNLNDNDPRIVCYDINYKMVRPDNITILDDDRVQITFVTPFTGTIVALGGVQGIHQTGYGEPPSAVSSKTGLFFVYANLNDKLRLSVDGNAQTITLTAGPHWSVDDIIFQINSQWLYGVASNDNGRIKLSSTKYGRVHNLFIDNIANNGADDLGFTLGMYSGYGLEPACILASKTGPFTITLNSNDEVKILTNYNDPITVILTPGVRTITQIVTDLNTAFTTDNYPAIASDMNGKLQICATTMDGIHRAYEGTYYTDFTVPVSFIAQGIANNKFQDVWYYAPTASYGLNFIPDDTCCFLVYPENYFLDCGFNNYQYIFKLMNDFLYKGEIKDIVITVEALPKANTPNLNDWILPIVRPQYMLLTYGGEVVTNWTDVTLNTGSELKIRMDSTNMQDGAYRMRVKMGLPNGEILISDWMRLNIVNLLCV